METPTCRRRNTRVFSNSCIYFRRKSLRIRSLTCDFCSSFSFLIHSLKFRILPACSFSLICLYSPESRVNWVNHLFSISFIFLYLEIYFSKYFLFKNVEWCQFFSISCKIKMHWHFKIISTVYDSIISKHGR